MLNKGSVAIIGAMDCEVELLKNMLEDVKTIEDVYEPYLLQSGLIQRTPRGRKLSPEGYRCLGLKLQNKNGQTSLF